MNMASRLIFKKLKKNVFQEKYVKFRDCVVSMTSSSIFEIVKQKIKNQFKF